MAVNLDQIKEQARASEWNCHNDALKLSREKLYSDNHDWITFPLDGQSVQENFQLGNFQLGQQLVECRWQSLVAVAAELADRVSNGGGVVQAGIMRRKGSYDHHYANAAIKWHWKGTPEKPEVVDFFSWQRFHVASASPPLQEEQVQVGDGVSA